MPPLVLAWLRAHAKALALYGSGLGLGLVVAQCRLRPAAVPAKDQHTLDSLEITRPLFAAAVETLTVQETTYAAQGRQAARGADLQRASADSLAAAADAAQRVAEAQQDSSTTWRVVAELRKVEADALRTSNDSLRSALTFEQLARGAADARALRALQRDSVSEALNQRLAADVGRAGQCRVLFIRCPSRKAAAIGSALVGAAAMYELSRR